MAAFNFRRRKTRRWWYAGAALTAAAFFAVFFVVGAGATIGASTFEGDDGNLVVDTAGQTDWASPPPNLSVGQDLPTGTGDNSFGQGAKEDNVNTTVVSGSIPNSKADLARFAAAGEVIGGDTYLYIAWSRANQSGTVNFDFELNQAAQPNLTTPGAKILNRTANDVLINYAFAGGSNTPTLTKYHWNGSNWVSDGAISGGCEEGATNSQTVSENLGGLSPVDRPAQQFGEASINLTCAGIVQSASCAPFASIYVKSRSSTSFTSEIKDFIAPIPLTLTTCGAYKITKTSTKSSTAVLAGATFHVTGPNGYDHTFTTDSTGVICQGNLPNGSYTVTETGAPPGYALDDTSDHTISVNGGSCPSPAAAAQLTFHDTPLTNISLNAHAQTANATKSKITCSGTSDDGLTTATATSGTSFVDPANASQTGLHPGTYTCTIVIDP